MEHPSSPVAALDQHDLATLTLSQVTPAYLFVSLNNLLQVTPACISNIILYLYREKGWSSYICRLDQYFIFRYILISACASPGCYRA
jgi:hypothetical protein